ncbi:Putative uncharacterized protein [Halomonas sp. R57-5]|nr:Putative uncharacterized protein [Halomonas sp. R57-5]
MHNGIFMHENILGQPPICRYSQAIQMILRLHGATDPVWVATCGYPITDVSSGDTIANRDDFTRPIR